MYEILKFMKYEKCDIFLLQIK